jgi:fatty-acyl-CoA synthase
MFGLMQDRPLLISSLIEHAATFHGAPEIVSRLPEGPVRRSNWAEVRQRACQVANALRQLGVQPGTASPRWPGTATATWRCTSASPASGAVLHTVNPRLFPEQIDYIVNHAEDGCCSSTSPSRRWWRGSRRSCQDVKGLCGDVRPRHDARVDLPNLLCWRN